MYVFGNCCDGTTKLGGESGGESGGLVVTLLIKLSKNSANVQNLQYILYSYSSLCFFNATSKNGNS